MSCTDKKYVVKEIIVTSDAGLQGPEGPQGPAGPPGPVPDEYPADQVTLADNPPYNTVQEALDALLYVPVEITDLDGGVALYETGVLLAALTFDWTINKTIVSQGLTGPPEMTPVVLNATQRSQTVILANLGSNATFILQVDDGTMVDMANWPVTFTGKNYFGDAEIPGVIDDAFLLSLNGVLKTNRTHIYTTNAIVLQYNWYACRSSYGTPVFTAGGFEGGYQFVQTLSHTNANGHTEDYDIYRSDFPDIGPGLTIEVD